MQNSTLALVSTPSSKRSEQKSVIIDSLDDVFFLVREPNRFVKPTLFIRLRLGEIAPRRYGPFPDLKQAKACLRAMAVHFEDALGEEMNNLGEFAAEYGSESSALYNIEH
jgi:hypothetical protein